MPRPLTHADTAPADLRVRTAHLMRRVRLLAAGAVVLYLAIAILQGFDVRRLQPWLIAGAIALALLTVNVLSRRWDMTRGHGADRQRREVAADAVIALGIFVVLTTIVPYQPYPLVILLLVVEAALRLQRSEAMALAWVASGIVLGTRGLAQAGFLPRVDDSTVLDIVPMTVTTLLLAWIVSVTVTRLYDERARAVASAEHAARATMLAERRADQLDERNSELQDARDEFERFSTKVAHDLRSPMSTIVMMATMVGRPDVDEEDRVDLAGRILPCAQRALALIDRLHAHARAGLQELDLDDVDLVDLVAQVRADLDLDLDGGEISVTVSGELPIVHGDAVLLRQVLTNLLSNAGRHARPDGGTIHVRVSGGTGEGHGWLNIHDDGEGVPEELRATIFETGRTGRHSLGLGIGLATCRDVVERHGGNIVLDETEVGASFSLMLPTHTRTATQTSSAPRDDTPVDLPTMA